MGRHTILNSDIRNAVVNALRSGVKIEVAADYAGVGRSTVWEWIKKGTEIAAQIEKANSEGIDHKINENEIKYLDFAEDVAKEQAADEIILAGTAKAAATTGIEYLVKSGKKDAKGEDIYVTRHVAPDGKLALEILARKYHKGWGRHQAIELTGAEGGPVQIKNVTPTASLLRTLEEIGERERQAREDREIVEAEIVEMPEAKEG